MSCADSLICGRKGCKRHNHPLPAMNQIMRLYQLHPFIRRQIYSPYSLNRLRRLPPVASHSTGVLCLPETTGWINVIYIAAHRMPNRKEYTYSSHIPFVHRTQLSPIWPKISIRYDNVLLVRPFTVYNLLDSFICRPGKAVWLRVRLPFGPNKSAMHNTTKDTPMHGRFSRLVILLLWQKYLDLAQLIVIDTMKVYTNPRKYSSMQGRMKRGIATISCSMRQPKYKQEPTKFIVAIEQWNYMYLFINNFPFMNV